jgi:hypothetical protein
VHGKPSVRNFPTPSSKAVLSISTRQSGARHKLGLKTAYSKRGPEYRYIRSLMGLPFLPCADIQPAFDQLAPRATSPELTQLVNYIDNSWLSSTVWLPRNWSIYQLTIRTNNDVEGTFS